MKLLKYFLLCLVFALFGLHAIQLVFHVIPQSPLTGGGDTTRCPLLTLKSYYYRDFQTNFERYTEEKMGFHPLFIQSRNQLDYSVFSYTDAPGVVLGKNKTLFIESYIQNFKGSVFKGEEVIRDEVRRLRMIQDELLKHNVGFLLIFAPGKATFYQERIPDHYRQRPYTNYRSYLGYLPGSGINFIDMNAWFLKLKGKTPYPLYPRNGAHWTCYGIGLAADSMFRYIGKLKHIDLPGFAWDNVELSDSMRYSDNDIGVLVNLLHPLKNDPMPYPHFIYNQEGKTRPRVIAIADSYWWGFAYTGITSNVFAKDKFWFYFRDIHENENKTGLVADVDLKAELFSQDLVILVVTEATFELFPYGFIDAFFKKCMPVPVGLSEGKPGVRVHKTIDTETKKGIRHGL